MKKFSSGCTLDCADCCAIDVYVENNKIIKIEGSKSHPYTKGFICKKGFKHLDYLNHEKRIYNPKLKVNGIWEDITFKEALNIMAKKLNFYKNNFGSNFVLYYEQYGSGSLLKSIGEIFCNFYGGVVKTSGGPCWSAGMKAQKYDLGDAKSNSLEDMLNSKSIILWGKNPAYTAIHTASFVKKAKEKGIEVIVIDPLYTETAKKLATKYIRINPGTDDALALAMNKLIIERNLYDKDYIDKYVLGFNEFKGYLETLDIKELVEISGVTFEELEFLVRKYSEKYSSIHIGYGVQKYKNGGNTVRAINALGAITGQIGFEGGGINYANKVYPKILNTDPYNSESYGKNKVIPVTRLVDYINSADNEPIKMALIYKSNMFNQLANVNRLKSAMDSIEFKVCCDLFLTETAKECDLFIPATNVFESEDLLYSSMNNPYLIYKEEILEPKNKLMDEYYFFRELAKLMGINDYPSVSKKEYLEEVIKPLKDFEREISLEYIKNTPFTIHKAIAWENKIFDTNSGKIEIYSEKAKSEGLTPMATLNKERHKSCEEYPIKLITVHHRDSLSSQHFIDEKRICQGYINEKTANLYKINHRSIVKVKSKNGEIELQINIDNSCDDNIMKIYAGWWAKQGNPNYLTDDGESDMGGQITYNESWVTIDSNVKKS